LLKQFRAKMGMPTTFHTNTSNVFLRLATSKIDLAGSNSGRRAAECKLGRVVYIHVPLSPSSIIWFRLMGGDASRLGR